MAASTALMGLVLAPVAAHAGAAASTTVGNLHIQLIDLDAADGITPGITFGFGSSTTGWLQVMTSFGGVPTNDHVDVAIGAGYGPLMGISGPGNYAMASMLAGDLFGIATGPGSYVMSTASSADTMEWAVGHLLPVNFTLTAHTRMLVTATVAPWTQASLGDTAIAYGTLAGSDLDNNYFATAYAESSVHADGTTFNNSTSSLQISFDNTGASDYSGYLHATASAFSSTAAAVPEPQSVALMLAGLAVLGAGVRRRSKGRGGPRYGVVRQARSRTSEASKYSASS